MSPLHGLPDAEFMTAMVRRYKGIPSIVLQDPDLMQFFLPILRADLAMLETYVYRPDAPLACPLTAFGGREDELVAPADLAAWLEQTSGEFTLRMFAGNHFFLQAAQATVLRAVADCLRSHAVGTLS
jgi:medium-chain acyl-[acyl-carrier-protein] hydrolase